MDDIRKAEREADEIIQNAEKMKLGILQQARQDSARILREKEQETKQARERFLQSGREKISAARAGIIENGRLQLKELEKQGNRREEKALEFLLSAFEDGLK